MNNKPQSALDTQVGGSHYKNFKIQPVEFIHQNGIGYMAGNVIKYVSRYKEKNGIEDLKKARHYIDMMIEFEQEAEREPVQPVLLSLAERFNAQTAE
nr:MAG TPA: nucelotide kinase [Caudoviricetes sp.]